MTAGGAIDLYEVAPPEILDPRQVEGVITSHVNGDHALFCTAECAISSRCCAPFSHWPARWVPATGHAKPDQSCSEEREAARFGRRVRVRRRVHKLT
jgi:hypothetical protein